MSSTTTTQNNPDEICPIHEDQILPAEFVGEDGIRHHKCVFYTDSGVRQISFGPECVKCNPTYKPPPQGLTSLSDLPTEIILNIFECLYNETRTAGLALGLTCTSLYKLLTTIHKIPINYEIEPLFNREIRHTLNHKTGTNGFIQYSCKYIISEVMPSQYRETTHDRRFKCIKTPYLLRSVYGNTAGPKEFELARRWRLYTYLEFQHRDVFHYCTGPALPAPFRRGDEWYVEAFREVGRVESHGFTIPWGIKQELLRCGAGFLKEITVAYPSIMGWEPFWEGLWEWNQLVGF